MQLILIIAGEEYASDVTSLLAKHDYYATEIGCNGEFLQYGEIIYLLGVEKNKVDEVIEILKTEDGRHSFEESSFQNKVKLYVLPTFGYHKTQIKA